MIRASKREAREWRASKLSLGEKDGDNNYESEQNIADLGKAEPLGYNAAYGQHANGPNPRENFH